MVTNLFSEQEQIFQLGVESAREGDRESAARLFRLLVRQQPDHIPGLLWLGGLSASPAERRRAFERALALDPANRVARKGLLGGVAACGPALPAQAAVAPLAPAAPLAHWPADAPGGRVARRLTVEVGQSTVKLRLSDAGALRVYEGPCRLDPVALRALLSDPQAYGRALFHGVFHGVPSAGAAAGRTTLDGYHAASGDGAPLRVELLLDRNCAYLHRLLWEYLLPPASDEPLAIRERAPLYRLAGEALPSAGQGRAGRLRILAAICSPRDLGRPGNRRLHALAPLDGGDEPASILGRAGLDHLQREARAEVRVLSRSCGGPVTPWGVRLAVAAGCDVLHLVCHGVFIGEGYHLVMEDEGGGHAFVSAEALVAMVADHLPALIILSACQSAIAHTGDALRGLAARLVGAGAPAVLAMQGMMPIASLRLFNERFYRHLARCGRAEAALAAARKDLFGAPGADDPARDWAIPLLLLRHDVRPLVDLGDEGPVFAQA